jgi:EmrB/QacA subfamily drug resistance transporter
VRPHRGSPHDGAPDPTREPPGSHPPVADRHATRTLLILMLSALAYALAQTMIVPALPEIQRDVHTTPQDATWLLTAFLLTSSVCTPLLGRLGDMYGKERLLLAALSVFGVGSLIAALGHSLAVLVAGRAVQGAGGAIFPLAIGIVRDEFPRERVASGIGSISAMFGIGGGAGLVLAGVLVDGPGYAWIFWLSLLACALAAVATWRWVPESPVRVPARVDGGGAALLSLALLALLLGVSEGNAWGWLSGRVLGLFAASVVVGAAWVSWELRVTDPLVDIALMRRRAVWTTNLATLAVGFAMFGSYILIPQLVQAPASTGYGFGASVIASGVFLLPSALVMLFAGPLSGRLGARYGSKLPMAIGGVAAAAAYLWLAAAHGARIDIYLAGALLGLGIGFALAAGGNLIVEAVPASATGVASAVNAIMRSIGGAIGAQIAAAIVGAKLLAGGFPAESGYTAAFAMSGGAALVALAVTAMIPGARARRHERALATAATEGA